MPNFSDDFQTIPYGRLGIIALPAAKSLQQKSTSTLLTGAQREKANTKRLLHSQVISVTLTLLRPHLTVSVQAKLRQLSINL